MKFRSIVLSLAVLPMMHFVPIVFGQEWDGSDLRRETRERDERVNKLSTEEQLKLRAAEQQAAQDPAVKAALERRNTAIREFRTTLRASMLKADPSVQSILEKVSIKPKPTPRPAITVPPY
jgi:hypothetical protein